jgi:hypothetical protein
MYGRTAGGRGVYFVIALDINQRIQLVPDGLFRIARLRVAVTVPPSGCAPARLAYVDGLIGDGQPVDNVIPLDGESLAPFKGESLAHF